MQVPKSSRAVTSILVAVLSCLSVPAAAQNCAQLVADWPHGPADAVYTAHGTSYFGSGTVLVIGDVSDISDPQIEGFLDLGMLIGDIVAVGNTVIVAAGNFDGSPGAVITVDVSDRANPTMISQTSTPLPANSLAVADGIAFVGLVNPREPGDGQLMVVDLTHPDFSGNLSLPGWPEALILDGETLWVNELGTGARAFDVTAPFNPLELAFLSGNVRDLDADDGILYLAQWGSNHDDALRIVDVSDPSSPTELAHYDATRPRKVDVFGRAAYLLSAPSETSIRLDLVDVSPPDDPTRLGVLSIGGSGGDLLINDLSVAASIAYLTHSQGGPVVVNTLDATEPRVAGTFHTPGLAMSLALDGDLLALAAGSSGLAVIDLAGDGAELPTPSDTQLPFAQDVALANGYAFVASWGHGIRIYDVSNPSQPQEIAVVETGYRFFRTVVSDDILYASFLGSPYVRTAIFDVSDPAHPVELAELQGAVLAVDRGHAYADWSDWLGQCALATWNVSDPANPGIGTLSHQLLGRLRSLQLALAGLPQVIPARSPPVDLRDFDSGKSGVGRPWKGWVEGARSCGPRLPGPDWRRSTSTPAASPGRRPNGERRT